jgi:molybdopterin converting factor small subunit
MLRSALLFSAVGAAAVLGVEAVGRATGLDSSAGTASRTSAASSETPGPAAGGSVTVKVVYFGMPLAVASSKDDLFVLESPANFGDLLDEVVKKHPAISAMIPTMIVSVNGVPAGPGTPMRDRDVVDLVPATAGG